MSKYICQYCSKELASKSSFNNHIAKARYCIKNRNKTDKIIQFVCKDCDKHFTSKQSLEIHSLKCIEKAINKLKNDYESKIAELEFQNQEQKQTIIDLQNKLQEVALTAVSRPTKTTQINNYIQQLQPVTDEYLNDNIKHLSIEHILKGPEGYADYALEYPLKNRLICVDYSRRKVKFKDKDGNIITDPEMNNLATKFFNSIKDKNKELIFKYGEKLQENFGDEIDTIVKILEYKTAVDNSSSSCNKTEFHHDFVKRMCSKTIKE